MCAQKAAVGYKGKLIAFEGIDRAGKSSIIKRLPDLLSGCNVPIVVCGEFQSPFAPIIRDLVHRGSSPFLKTFLFAADRAWAYERECLPALKRGELVLWDRYVDSAVVYRTVEFSRSPSDIDIDLDFVKDINRLFVRPVLTIYIDVTVETSRERARLAGTRKPYSPEFLENVRAEYRKVASMEEYVIINSERPLDAVVAEVGQVIRQRFKEVFP
jgi:dTMP kinase